MEYKLHNGSGGLCCKGCSRQDKKLNTYDWLADIPGNAEESDMVEVQFKNTRKGYFRNSNKIKLEKGDVVAVEAAPGHDIGVVTLTGRLVPLQMKKANFKADTEIKRVYRKWFNSKQREEPYQVLTLMDRTRDSSSSSEARKQVVHGCRQLVS